MAQIALNHVSKTFNNGSIVAVNDLSLEIEDEEFLVLVGPSGCGKSTTLRMIAGLEDPTDGDISIGTTRVNGLEPRERDIAMVFQNYALYPHMNVRENIGFGLRLSTDLSDADIEERVEDVADLLEIGELLEKKPKSLSGGQQQRVALGRAIVRDPEAFLFDEPLSNLDAKLRKQMRTEISRIQEQLGVTSIYVTHDQEEAMTMGDRIAVMNDGALQQIGEPNDVYNHPTNLFVAGFIGSPSMNTVEAEVVRRDGRTLLESVTGDAFTYDLDATADANADHPVEAGDRVTVGVRPEDVVLRAEAAAFEGQHHTTTVDVVEPLGSDNLLYFDVGSRTWTARVSPGFEPESGTSVHFGFPREALYIFDEEGTTVESRNLADPAEARQVTHGDGDGVVNT
jgi:multiple sugar transport system ATP-binding protein